MPAHHLFSIALSLSGILHSLETACIYVLAFAFVFGILAFSHEFGHFITAKMLGMSVDQFGIGFPPTHGWTVLRRSGTSYTIHPIPLGAFVRIRGMDPSDQDSPNSFLRQPPWARLIVLSAGSAANMLLAVFVFILMGVTTGIPSREYVTNEVRSVEPGSAAANAHLRSGDLVLGIRRQGKHTEWMLPKRIPGSPSDATELVALIHSSWTRQHSGSVSKLEGMPLILRLQHSNGQIETVTGRPSVQTDPQTNKPVAILGYRPGTSVEYERVGCFTAVGRGIDAARGKALFLIDVLYGSVSQLVRGAITPTQFGNGFGGPLRIAQISGEFVRAGLPDFMGFVGMLSINLAVLNLLPLPIFDGGNIILVLLEVIRRKQLDPEQFVMVQLVGLVFISLIFLYLTYHDILHLAQSKMTP